MQRNLNFLVNLGLFILVILIGILLIELFYRISLNIPILGTTMDKTDLSNQIFKKSNNDWLVYELIPNAKSYISGVHFQINSHGMRDKEYSLQKPEGTYRIAVLGDSIVYGYGINISSTFTKRLEAKLNTNFSVEVLNFGVPGYSTQQEIEMYRVKAKRFSPDMIIIGYVLNDEYLYSGNSEFILFGGAYDSIISRSYFLDSIKRHTKHFLKKTFKVNMKTIQMKTNVYDNFVELRNEVGQEKPVLIIIFPYIVDYDRYDKYSIFDEERKISEIHEQVREAALKNNYHVLDLLPYFSKIENDRIRLSRNDFYHPNALGHEIVAEISYKYLIRNDIISG